MDNFRLMNFGLRFFALWGLLLWGRRVNGGTVIGCRRQFVAQFNGQPITGIFIANWWTVANDSVHARDVIAEIEVVCSVPQGVGKTCHLAALAFKN
jgi:hypothetical protein